MDERRDRKRRGKRDRRAELITRLTAGAVILTIAVVLAAVIISKRNTPHTDINAAGYAGVLVESMSAGAYITPTPEPSAKSGVSSAPEADPADSSSSPSEDAKISQAAGGEMVETDMSGDWRLILVNPSHKLPEGFEAETRSIWDGEPERIDYRIYDDLHAMLDACESAGYSPVIRSSYRTWRDQEDLFESKTEEFMAEGESYEEAKADAATIVAIPGTSEHQLGLALDIVSGDYGTLNAAQADNPTQQWLMQHSYEYGFILRYPTDKGSITGIIYEPWHYRYVGKEAAAAIYEEGLCLEEYLAKYGNGGKANDES